MKTILTIGAAALLLCGCVAHRHERVAVVYSDGYYDGYYGPYSDGYWGPDGFFYYSSGGRFVRDDNHHFRRDTGPGFVKVRVRPAPDRHD